MERSPCPLCDGAPVDAGLCCAWCVVKIASLLLRGDDELLRRIWDLPEEWQRPRLPLAEAGADAGGHLGLMTVVDRAAIALEAKAYRDLALSLANASLHAEALAAAAAAFLRGWGWPTARQHQETLARIALRPPLLRPDGTALLREVLAHLWLARPRN